MKPFLRITFYLSGLLVLLLAVFILTIILTDYRPPGEETLYQSTQKELVPDSGKVFNVMTWNIGYGGLGKGMDFFYDGGRGVRAERSIINQNMDQILQFMYKGRMIDFWFVQEVDMGSRRSFHMNQYEMLQSRLGYPNFVFAKNYDVVFVPVPLHNPLGRVLAGQVTVSRYQPSRSTRYAFPGNYPWPKGLFLLDRCFILNRYALVGGKELLLINTHNSAFDDGSLRREQLGILVDIMESEYGKGNYVVAGGDWNMNPPGFDPSLIYTGDATMTVEPALDDQAFPMGWTVAFDPQVPTNRSLVKPYLRGSTPTTIIDFFVCSPNVEVVNVKGITLMFEHTDHNPVLMQFSLW